jgi:SOS-response transcriptional repressor LexA
MPTGISAEDRLLIASKIKELLERPGMSQEVLGRRAGVDQAVVSRWKSGQRTPSAQSVIRIADLFEEEDKAWLLSKVGLSDDVHEPIASRVKRVPLFKGKIAAGHGREIEGEIEDELALPRQWFSTSSKIIALKVDGESMSPLVNHGYYVLIDSAQTDITRLAGHMVAARAPQGCTVKWLRKDQDSGFYLLVPHHVSESYPIRTITPENQHEFGIIGRVVRWIGEPKPPGKMKR